MSEDLIFASENEAIQHLADVTGKQIIVATEDDNKEYAQIVFMQNSQDFDEFTDKSTGEKGVDAFFGASEKDMMDFLMQWEQGDRGEVSKTEPWGTNDKKFEKKVGDDTYIMSYNSGMEYASLVRVEEAELKEDSRGKPSELVGIFMERDELIRDEAENLVSELKERVADGENPEEVLHDEGLEPDYIFDIM